MSTELAKMFNAAQLMINGVTFSRTDSFVQSFHGSQFPSGDYGNLVAANSGVWHGWFRHQVDDNLGNGVFARFVTRSGIGIPDLVEGSCLIYDSPNSFSGPRLASSDPVFRAATLVHEAWHAWEDAHGQLIGTGCGHTACPTDGHPKSASCGAGSECDIWTPHPQGACPPPSPEDPFCSVLGDEGSMSQLMHRPYQAANETCDGVCKCDFTTNCCPAPSVNQ
jgi:hypothetical protein